MKKLRPQCSHCIYWVADHDAAVGSSGHCHRYPPGVYVNPNSGTVIQKFPSTDHHHWCGEWNNDSVLLEDMVRRTAANSATSR